MKTKLAAMILALLITLTACGQKEPERDLSAQDAYDHAMIYVRYSKDINGNYIPEEYYTLCAAMVTTALNELKEEGVSTKDATWKWVVEESGYLGMKTVALEFDCNGVTKTLGTIITTSVG